MRISFILLGILFCAAHPVAAQENADLELVSSLINKWQSIRSVRFAEDHREKSFFGEDTIAQSFETVAFFDATGKIASWENTVEMEGYTGRTVFNNGTVYSLETDSTYTFRTEARPPTGFGDLFSEYGILDGFRKSMANQPKRITRLNDTTINGVECHYFKNNSFDSVVNNERNYTDVYLAFEKRKLRPVYSMYTGYGTMVKDGTTIGSFSLYGSSHYGDLETDIGDNYLADFSVSDGYRVAEKLSLLAAGDPGPEWDGQTTDNLHLTSAGLIGNYALLFLTDVNCPGNQLSIKLVNKLHDRYRDGKLNVIGIYGDNRQRLERYLASNPLTFPAVYDGQAIKNDFHAPGAPFFYIIDPQGNVAFSRYGYSDDLEELLTEKLDGLLN